MNKRTSGILLPITSLPGPYGIGDFGPQAFKFADFLSKSKQSCWQILPLTLPNIHNGCSPYDCISAFAGNKALISSQRLYESGLLSKSDLKGVPKFSRSQVQYHEVAAFKKELLNKACEKFKSSHKEKEYEVFCRDNDYWLKDYTLFAALAEHFKTSDWAKWPAKFRNAKTVSIDDEIKSKIENEKIVQYLFFTQWLSLKNYCNKKGINIIGDIALYISYQSADVWANPEIFKLNKEKEPMFISGVPPDLFSDKGQLWGNPIYDWAAIKRTNYDWWVKRIKHNLNLYDTIRIDHFRGLVKYWQVPAGHKTAKKGKWIDGPGEEFFNIVFKDSPRASMIVEDLGYITSDVKELVKKLELTGMKVLLFAFDDFSGHNTHQPHNYIENCIAYTGTHDNNTVIGWYKDEAQAKHKNCLAAYIGQRPAVKKLNWEFIRLAMSSVARTAIVPMQDILGLASESRMNNPANSQGNWQWRLKEGQIKGALAGKLAKITELYGRA